MLRKTEVMRKEEEWRKNDELHKLQELRKAVSSCSELPIKKTLDKVFFDIISM